MGMPNFSSISMSEAERNAFLVLRDCTHKSGFLASGGKPGYPQVWARDAMMTGLGVLNSEQWLVQGLNLGNVMKASLETLAKHQSSLGMIPMNVDTRTGKPEPYNNGAQDAPSWYVIGLEAFVRAQKPPKAFVRRHFTYVKTAMFWLACQEQNGDGLIEMQEAGDWEDLFAVRGTGLYINVLWYAALVRASRLAKRVNDWKLATKWAREAGGVKNRINERLWVSRPPKPHKGEWDHVREKMWKNLGLTSFYVPYYTFWQYGTWCDSLGNLAAIVFGVADKRRADAILKHFDKIGMARPYPTKALLSIITQGKYDWRDYYRKNRLNLPNCYHNGGIWPMIGGWHALALVKSGKVLSAKKILERLVEANKKGKEREWEFNEWLHGKTGKPKGMVKQAWSAAMFLAAADAVRLGRIPASFH